MVFWLFMLISTVSIIIIFSIVYWSDNSHFNTPKIKFTSFKKFYEINPKRWQLNHGTVDCRTDTFVYEKFHFSYFDFYKYRSWFNKLWNSKQQEKHNKSIQRMMDAVKQDIANSEAEAKKIQHQAFDDLIKWAKENTNKDVLDLQKLVEEYKKIYENIQ